MQDPQSDPPRGASAPPKHRASSERLLPFEALRIPPHISCESKPSVESVALKGQARLDKRKIVSLGQSEQVVGLASFVERAEQEQQQRHVEVMNKIQELLRREQQDVLLKELQLLQQVQQLQLKQVQELQQQLQQQEVQKELQQQRNMLKGLQQELAQQRQQREDHRQPQGGQRQQELHRQQQGDDWQEQPNSQQEQQPEQPMHRQSNEERPRKSGQSAGLSPEALEDLKGHLDTLVDRYLGNSDRRTQWSGTTMTFNEPLPLGLPGPEPRSQTPVSDQMSLHDSKAPRDITPPIFEKAVEYRAESGVPFAIFSMCLVILHAIFLGVEMEWTMECARQRVPVSKWIFWTNLSFNIAFAIEMLLRVCVDQAPFFTGKHRWWNFFDTALVVNGWISMTTEFLDFSGGRVLRAVRLIRVVRLMKVLRYMQKPRLIAAVLCSSFPSAFWCFLLLIFTIYMFAVCFLQSVEEDVRESGVVGDPLDTYYGSMGRTMLCLFQAISGGKDWHTLLQPLEDASAWYLVPLFIFYVAFVLFFIVNVLTAIFVDGVRQIATVDPDLHVLEEADKQKSMLQSIQRNLPDSPIITREQLERHLGTFEAQQFFLGVGVDCVHVMRLYDLLQTEAERGVKKSKLALTILQLRSTAAGVDIAMLMVELQWLRLSVSSVIKDMTTGFGQMDADMSALLRGRRTSMQPFTSKERIQGMPALARSKTVQTLLSTGEVDKPTRTSELE